MGARTALPFRVIRNRALRRRTRRRKRAGAKGRTGSYRVSGTRNGPGAAVGLSVSVAWQLSGVSGRRSGGGEARGGAGWRRGRATPSRRLTSSKNHVSSISGALPVREGLRPSDAVRSRWASPCPCRAASATRNHALSFESSPERSATRASRMNAPGRPAAAADPSKSAAVDSSSRPRALEPSRYNDQFCTVRR